MGILSLIHGSSVVKPSQTVIARTIEEYNKVFCQLYPVNSADTASGIPGILYGRYAADKYGSSGPGLGGNPWVLLTASVASLLYQNAQSSTSLQAEELDAWSSALNMKAFGGSSLDFIAAGDAVLARLHHHVQADDYHLFEQIDRVSGKQYNAGDLTWSYAETLSALLERESAVKLLQSETNVVV